MTDDMSIYTESYLASFLFVNMTCHAMSYDMSYQ